ncbi:hypothetical protein NDU88_011033 [Pleurodeles waltl]|uniref:Uncharacterized protein n=1 Tax=Pleurodeles waltl TaxID=8319 RepID=A0AAV7QWD2_PLEWA|nr:hypothetical protein NDU88_011033 [Pleurodeles waltl]
MFTGHWSSPVSPFMSPILLASARSEASSGVDGRPPRKLITSFYQKVNKAPQPQQTTEKTNVKPKEKEGCEVQGGDLEKNDNADDHGVDEDGEPNEWLARNGEKRAAGSNIKGTKLTLVGPLGFGLVDEVVKVVMEQICGNLCSIPKSQLSVSVSQRLRCRPRISQGGEYCGGILEPLCLTTSNLLQSGNRSADWSDHINVNTRGKSDYLSESSLMSLYFTLPDILYSSALTEHAKGPVEPPIARLAFGDSSAEAAC